MGVPGVGAMGPWVPCAAAGGAENASHAAKKAPTAEMARNLLINHFNLLDANLRSRLLTRTMEIVELTLEPEEES